MNSNWLIFGGVSTAGISFLTAVFVARLLSVEEFGVLQFTLTTFFFIQLSENLVYPGIFKRILLEEPQNREILYRLSIQLMLAVGLITSVPLALAYLFTQNEVILYLAILCFGLIFRAFIGLSYALDAELKSRATQLYQLGGLCIGSFIRIVGALLSPTALLQIISMPIQFFVVSFGHFRNDSVGRKALKNFMKWNVAEGHRLFRLSVGFFVVALLNLLLYRIDTILLGLVSSAEEVAIYSVAVKLSEPWLFIGSALSSSFFPILVRSRAASLTKYYTYFSFLFWILTLSSIVLAALISFFSESIIILTFGEKYLQSAPVLRISIWTIVPLFIYSLHHVWDVCENLDKWAIQRSAFAAIANVILNLIFIPKYGSQACAAISVLTYFLYSYGFNLIHRKGRLLLRKEISFAPKGLKLAFKN